MTIGEFLAKVLEWIYEFWPLRVVRQWEQGIRLHAGEITALLTYCDGPFPGARGLHWFVPLVGEIMVESCNWETGQSWIQSLESRDGCTVTALFSVTFRIRDLRLYYKTIHDHQATIYGAVRSAAGEVIPTLAWDERAKVAELMLEAVKKRVRGWGLEVGDVMPAVLVRSKALRLLQ